MVFCGKPSKGCSTCRARKIKCDQLRPSCTQCGRIRQICPGYRDQLALLFRDESEAVVRKARSQQVQTAQPQHRVASAERGKPSSSIKPSFADSTVSQPQPPTSLAGASRTLSPSLDQQALCFFHGNYVLHLGGNSKVHQDYLRFLCNQSVNNGAVFSTLAAVGLAGLANIKNAPEIMMIAREKYALALRLTNAALQDPFEAKSNLTLRAVLLLSMYEIITCSSPRSMKSWTNHIYGAAALLELRGPEQFQNRSGLQLFLQLRSQILISCLQRETYVPDAVRKWSKEISRHQTPNERHSNKLADIITLFCNTRAKIKDNILTDSRLIISSMSAIETSLAKWSTEDLPPDWAYTIIPSDDSSSDNNDDIYQGHHHIYHDTWMASSWNNYRCARILVNEVLLDHANRVFASTSPFTPTEYFMQCRHSRSILYQMSSDICASVPSFHVSLQPKGFSHLPRVGGAAGGFLLIWPLYVAGSMEGATHTLRSWVIRKLEAVGLALGVRQALALAGFLKEKEELVVCKPKKSEMIGDSEDFGQATNDDANGDDREQSEWTDYLGVPGTFF